MWDSNSEQSYDMSTQEQYFDQLKENSAIVEQEPSAYIVTQVHQSKDSNIVSSNERLLKRYTAQLKLYAQDAKVIIQFY